MAEENFLTYPEIDPNSRITVTATRVTWAGLTGNEDAYVYSDKGVNYFNGDFVHLLTLCITASVNNAVIYPWALTNTLDDIYGIYLAGGSFLGLRIQHQTTIQLGLGESDAGVYYESTYYVMTAGIVYYLKIVRDESVGTYGTLYLYIYSDAARTTLLATKSLALHTSKKDFRYIFAVGSYDNNSSYTTSAYTEDLTLEGGEAAVLPEVTQQAPTSIGATTATGNGYINSLGLSAVTAHGHCWATTANPTTANSKVDKGAGAIGAFTSAVTGLTAGTYYYIRAYATNSYGTSYSSNVLFLSGSSSALLEPNQIAVGNTTLLYTGRNGKRYYIQGVEF